MHPDPSSGPRRDNETPPRTPNTDMQPEDAGTPDSGVPEPGRGGAADPGRGTPAEPGMKQTDKTDDESGSRR